MDNLTGPVLHDEESKDGPEKGILVSMKALLSAASENAQILRQHYSCRVILHGVHIRAATGLKTYCKRGFWASAGLRPRNILGG
jgi:hypothetical protein